MLFDTAAIAENLCESVRFKMSKIELVTGFDGALLFNGNLQREAAGRHLKDTN